MRAIKNKDTQVVFISKYYDHFNLCFMADVGLVSMFDTRFEILDMPAKIAQNTLPEFK